MSETRRDVGTAEGRVGTRDGFAAHLLRGWTQSHRPRPLLRDRAPSRREPARARARGASVATHERTESGRRLLGRRQLVRRSLSGRRRVGRHPRQEHVSETCSELPDTFGPACSGSFDSLPFGGRRRVCGNRDALAVRRSIPIPHTTPLGTYPRARPKRRIRGSTAQRGESIPKPSRTK